MKTINDWRPESKSLLKTLQKHNVTILSVNNGDEDTNYADTTLGKFVDEMTACDEAHLYVQTPDGKKHVLYLVYGNSPGELVADYSIAPELDAATEEHYDKWEGRKQPKTTRTLNFS
jgi:hypothetical protein